MIVACQGETILFPCLEIRTLKEIVGAVKVTCAHSVSIKSVVEVTFTQCYD